MAKTKNLTLTLVRRVSDGNYGTFGAEVTIEVELEAGDDPKEIKANMLKTANRDLDRALEAIKPSEAEEAPKSKSRK